MQVDIAKANAELAGQHPKQIVEWAAGLDGRTIVTTNFGPNEAVILHLASQVQPDMPVVWIDSGYATRKTYLFAEKLINDLNLNIHVFNPLMSAARRDALMGIPDVDDPQHEEFTRQVKLEPFGRAMQEMAPDVWLTAVRRDQTEFRKNMEIVSQDKPGGVVKVAPVLEWTEADMQAYLDKHDLPNETSYYDPTKVLGNRECGLHNRFTA
ncbi:phosphoadenylylsulfate reductase [Salinisphaera orenii MK-B5]|uniref:Phosphoadenylylsulfate reductase n=2 Tax=Salinisphaera orenii TaxID=856731 RepID=A0A423PPW2_9GAMM|nr:MULTISPECIES: phosphoadenosine phosphosulfate reductase family protein [Salinisphaera]ROO27654.1 phosphoadenylylsulfate reductase [Salinisphaera orenii MK-B5]ROO37529.1 phosphoadenylylsulfate reductase [Salinisphaera halophila YIM 95161]